MRGLQPGRCRMAFGLRKCLLACCRHCPGRAPLCRSVIGSLARSRPVVGKQGDSVAVREESAQARSEPGGVDEVHEVAFAGMLVARLRGFLGSWRRVASITDLEPLIDILVHDQDIARPLGVDHPIPPDAAAAAADRVLGTPAPIRRWKPTTSLTPNREFGRSPAPRIECIAHASFRHVCQSSDGPRRPG